MTSQGRGKWKYHGQDALGHTETKLGDGCLDTSTYDMSGRKETIAGARAATTSGEFFNLRASIYVGERSLSAFGR